MKKLIIGILLSILLIYLSVRGIDFQAVMEGFKKIDYRYIYPAVLLIVAMQVIRSIRWGILLSPLEKVGQLALFSVTSVGFLAIVSIPARLGELARPYLITKKSGIKMSSALGTIFIERIFDGLTVFAVFVVILFLTPLPTWLIRSSILFLMLTIGMMAFFIFMIAQRELCMKMLDPLFCRLPERFAFKTRLLLHHFIDGFQILRDLKRLLAVALMSALFWFCDILSIYYMFLSFGFSLPPIAACVILIILMIGIAIPAGPGFVGNWHFFCILGLALYGIPKAEALSFAIIYHFISIGIIILLGMIFLPFNRFSFKDLKVNSK